MPAQGIQSPSNMEENKNNSRSPLLEGKPEVKEISGVAAVTNTLGTMLLKGSSDDGEGTNGESEAEGAIDGRATSLPSVCSDKVSPSVSILNSIADIENSVLPLGGYGISPKVESGETLVDAHNVLDEMPKSISQGDEGSRSAVGSCSVTNLSESKDEDNEVNAVGSDQVFGRGEDGTEQGSFQFAWEQVS
ncbi:hypothetical protein U1Q18_032660 [Sarracenia purpurea var. burkii]